MKKWLLASTVLVALCGAAFATAYFKDAKMVEAKFTLGRNIAETAKASGISKFGVDNIDQMLDYTVTGLPPVTVLVFDHPGMQVRISAPFSLTMFADHRRDPRDLVDAARVIVSGRSVPTHEAARAYVESLIGQFGKGTWKRYIAPSCPAVTGRSSILDLSGAINPGACAIDPGFKIGQPDWLALFADRQRYQWLGDGILATLEVGYRDAPAGVAYSIQVSFDHLATMAAVEAENERRELAAGDAQGWNSTVEAAAAKKLAGEQVKQLEANALKRGDQVVPRD